MISILNCTISEPRGSGFNEPENMFFTFNSKNTKETKETSTGRNI